MYLRVNMGKDERNARRTSRHRGVLEAANASASLKANKQTPPGLNWTILLQTAWLDFKGLLRLFSHIDKNQRLQSSGHWVKVYGKAPAVSEFAPVLQTATET